MAVVRGLARVVVAVLLVSSAGSQVRDAPEADRLRAGGPPPDGIPALDAPEFVAVGAVDFLSEDEPVVSLVIDGEARAYPLQIMVWHEIVNDTVAGVPVAVTYCPLCNSALAYERRLPGLPLGRPVLTFGTSGLLLDSALVMYDRQTRSLWSHFTARAIAGPLTGRALRTLPVSIAAWGAWKAAHPDGRVLGRATGHARDYGLTPYPGYDSTRDRPFLFEGEVDGRFTAMTRVVGIRRGGEALAVVRTALADRGALRVRVGGDDLWVLWHPGARTALGLTDIAFAERIGAVGVFSGGPDHLEVVDAGVRDPLSGAVWDVLGRLVEGPGADLVPAEHVDTFWFAWAAYLPDTLIWDGD